MQFNYSLLPKAHRRGLLYSLGFVAAAIIAFVISESLGSSGVTTTLQYLAVASMVAYVIYALVTAQRDKQAVHRFVTAYAASSLSENEMFTAVPPCFDSLRNNPQVVSTRVHDGYVFPLSPQQDCMVFIFEYVMNYGRSNVTHSFTVAVTEQPKVFPHLFLDSKQNGASYAYDTSQRLSLEGDFQDYFNLYVPEGEQIDSLTILTPDVMQTLVRGGRPYDIELVGNSVTLVAIGSPYTQRALPALFKFLDAFSKELNDSGGSWNQIDVSAALESKLAPRKLDTRIALVGLGLAAILLFFSWR